VNARPCHEEAAQSGRYRSPAVAKREHSGPRTGLHELVCQIGQGSYGEVWLARSVMGSYRAAKFIFRKTFKEAHPFQRELAGIQRFEPVSRTHPGFVHVLHVGRNEGEDFFYYLMEVADDVGAGQNIDPTKYTPKTLSTEIARSGKLPVVQVIGLAKQLTGALAHLHERGLVHRDIKPANIVFVHGAPKLADIGLVANLEDARSYVGTEGFIPPEGPGSASARGYL
jgi:eukaryotic-like serine/threonine-protein kinase